MKVPLLDLPGVRKYIKYMIFKNLGIIAPKPNELKFGTSKRLPRRIFKKGYDE